jgi:hypothetical protein
MTEIKNNSQYVPVILEALSTFLGRREENQVHLIPSRASPSPDEVPVRPGVRKNGQDQRQIRVPRKP